MPAVATTLCGIVAGLWIRAARPASAAQVLVRAGAALVLAGLVWDLWFPINKSLWTSSYVALTAGAAALILAVLHRYLDDGRAASWRLSLSEPLVALGRNALLLFVLSGLVARTMALVKVEDAGGAGVSLQQWVHRTVFAPLAAPREASLLFAAANLAAFYLLLAALHRRRWYWSV
jgi:predicted acyltransferase